MWCIYLFIFFFFSLFLHCVQVQRASTADLKPQRSETVSHSLWMRSTPRVKLVFLMCVWEEIKSVLPYTVLSELSFGE